MPFFHHLTDCSIWVLETKKKYLKIIIIIYFSTKRCIGFCSLAGKLLSVLEKPMGLLCTAMKHTPPIGGVTRRSWSYYIRPPRAAMPLLSPSLCPLLTKEAIHELEEAAGIRTGLYLPDYSYFYFIFSVWFCHWRFSRHC